MNVITITQTGLSALIEQLQKQKEELSAIYHAAISNGEKLHEVKTLYISLIDVDKKLTDLMRVAF
jgi:hypothetical protein